MPTPTRHFDQELDDLKQKLLAMASRAETAVAQAVQAMVTRDDPLALQVKEDDTLLDRHEIEIDEAAIHLLAKAPLATDLRFITIAMKISQNLERVGDEASKIAKRARRLNEEPPLRLETDIPAMARVAVGMLQAALDAFVSRDAAAARAVIPRDQEVDELHKLVQREIVRLMTASPAHINRGLHLLVVAKSIERIADHATNIAEEVVYLCEALDIRHSPEAKSPPPTPHTP